MAFIYQYDLVRSGEEIFNIYDNDNMEIIENYYSRYIWWESKGNRYRIRGWYQ